MLLLTTGAESNEAAIKMAKLYTGKYEIVSFDRSWHGMTSGAAAATYSAGRRGYGPALPGNLTLPTPNAYRSPFRHADGSYDWEAELDYGFDAVDAQSTGSLAACLVEPILSSGGVIELPLGYLAALKEMCAARGMLLIVDEAQTGLGRTGTMYAFERDGVAPDILTLSKTLGAGLPVAAVMTGEEIERVCARTRIPLLHHPRVGSVGRRGRAHRARRHRARRPGRARREARRPAAGPARSTCRAGTTWSATSADAGCSRASSWSPTRRARTPADALGAAITSACLERGLHMNIVQLPGMGGIFRIAPPLTISEADLETGLDILDDSVRTVVGSG